MSAERPPGQERGTTERPMQPHSPEAVTTIVEEAHAHGLPVTAHWGTVGDLRDVLAAGVDELQHLEARSVLDGWPGDVVDTMASRGIPLTPTLAVTEVAVTSEAHQQLGAGGRRITCRQRRHIQARIRRCISCWFYARPGSRPRYLRWAACLDTPRCVAISAQVRPATRARRTAASC